MEVPGAPPDYGRGVCPGTTMLPSPKVSPAVSSAAFVVPHGTFSRVSPPFVVLCRVGVCAACGTTALRWGCFLSGFFRCSSVGGVGGGTEAAVARRPPRISPQALPAPPGPRLARLICHASRAGPGHRARPSGTSDAPWGLRFLPWTVGRVAWAAGGISGDSWWPHGWRQLSCGGRSDGRRGRLKMLG